MTTVARLLRESGLAAVDARVLLRYVLGWSPAQLASRAEVSVAPPLVEAFAALAARRASGEPVAYIIGEREFYGLMFKVTPAVLIPRPETELLVELSLERTPARARVLDMGTGSGAIAVSLAHSRPDMAVTALDVSADALAVAQANALRLLSGDTPIRFLHSDWYGALGQERFDTIVSNPPYIEKDDAHLSQGDLRFEPAGALTDHADGLSALRTIITGAVRHLTQGGWLLMEHGYDQADPVRAMLHAGGFVQVQSWRDLAGIERVSGGRLA